MHFDIQIWILKKNNRLHSWEKKMSYHTNTKISISRYGYLRRTTDYIHKNYFEICQFSIRFFYKWWMVSGFLTEYFENLLCMKSVEGSGLWTFYLFFSLLCFFKKNSEEKLYEFFEKNIRTFLKKPYELF